MSAIKRLEELGIILPEPIKPVGSYVPALTSDNLLFLSGILPFKNGKLLYTGKVGNEVTVEQAQEAARQIVLNALSIVNVETGLDKIAQCIRLNGFVASASDFYNQPAVLNPASDLLKEVFGKVGLHTRIAVGVSVLPLNSPVEIDFIFRLKD